MQRWIFSIIAPVFSVTWSFSIHSNMLIMVIKNHFLLLILKTVVLLNIFENCDKLPVKSYKKICVTLVPWWREWRRGEIRGLPWEHESSLITRKRQWNLATGLCMLSRSSCIRVYIDYRCIHSSGFVLTSRELVLGSQWCFEVVAWGHNVSIPSIRERGYVRNRDIPYLSVTSSYVGDDIRGPWNAWTD